MDFDLNDRIPSPNHSHHDSDTADDPGDQTRRSIYELEAKLEIGATIESLSQVYFLYCEYGRLVGFSVRKGSQEYFRQSSEVRVKLFVCHCEGQPDGKASANGIAQYRKQQRRCGCRARLRVVRRKGAPWTVACFEKEHNHELLGADQGYLLRSSRNLTHTNATIIDALRSAGVPVSQSFRFLEKQTAGVQNVGFTAKDAYDHFRRHKLQTRVPNEDAHAVLQYWKDKSSNEPGFYGNVMLDDEGRIMNIFIRDSRSKLDYECFGDVLSVDTTFKTN